MEAIGICRRRRYIMYFKQDCEGVSRSLQEEECL